MGPDESQDGWFFAGRCPIRKLRTCRLSGPRPSAQPLLGAEVPLGQEAPASGRGVAAGSPGPVPEKEASPRGYLLGNFIHMLAGA